eukprot:7950925-Karenia_brevis.AAC.1
MQTFVKTLMGITTTLDVEAAVTTEKVKIESTLHLMLRLRGSLQSRVKSLNCMTIPLADKASPKFDNVKAKIQDNAGLSPEQHCHLFAGKQLENGRILSEYIIQKESTLRLALLLREGIQIFVETVTGKI